MKINALQKGVVDRAGMPYSRQTNSLVVANRQNLTTKHCRVANLLANLSGPETRLASRPGPHHNRMEVRHG